jgi:2-amino-4-hydroxy-6-hydroxymethyldihydropteridine diphosphokinase
MRVRVAAKVAARVAAKLSAFIGVGANLGDAQASNVLHGLQHAGLPDTALVAQSSLYRTAPLESSGADYVNAVVAIATSLTAAELLAHLQRIENQAGRQRPYRNAPRTLDLDILLYSDAVINTPDLVLPHPRMNERAFVLVPLAEIAPERVTTDQLARVSGQSIVRIPN